MNFRSVISPFSQLYLPSVLKAQKKSVENTCISVKLFSQSLNKDIS